MLTSPRWFCCRVALHKPRNIFFFMLIICDSFRRRHPRNFQQIMWVQFKNPLSITACSYMCNHILPNFTSLSCSFIFASLCVIQPGAPSHPPCLAHTFTHTLLYVHIRSCWVPSPLLSANSHVDPGWSLSYTHIQKYTHSRNVGV